MVQYRGRSILIGAITLNTLWHSSLPNTAAICITNLAHDSDLRFFPAIKRDTLHLSDVSTDGPVDAGTLDADENTQICRGPARVLAMAVSTEAILGISLHDLLKNTL